MAKIKNRTGEKLIQNNGLEAQVIEYRGVHDIDVKFSNGQIVKNIYYYQFKSRQIRCPMLYEPIENYIKCTNPNTGLVFIIDKDDFNLIKDFYWSATDGYACNSSKGLLHRYLMNPPKKMQIDHINHNILDNRRSNLRICTQTENLYNQNKYKNNRSGYKGVSKHGKKWRAYINKDGKRQNIGIFSTPELAHAAYCKAAKELHGEYAKLA